MSGRDRYGRRAAAAVLVAALGAGSTSAAVFRSGEALVVAADEVVTDDLYLSGETAEVHGTVEGDLVFAGGQLTVTGRVSGDLTAAGRAIVVDGEVGDDVRIAGMALKLGSRAAVADDLIAAGLSVESEAGSRVAGGARIASYQALWRGEVEEDLGATLVGLELDGRVGGDVEADVESEAAPAWWIGLIESPVAMPTVAPGLTLGGDARVGGDLRYESAAEAGRAAGAEVRGRIARKLPGVEEAGPPGPSLGRHVAQRVRRFAALLVVGLLLLWAAPKRVGTAGELLLGRPLVALGWGLLSLLALPVAMVALGAVGATLVILFGVTGVGPLAWLTVLLVLLSLVLLGVGFWLALAYLAPIVVARGVGGRVAAKAAWGRWAAPLALALGLAIVVLAAALPFVGGLLGLLLGLWGVGALVLSRCGGRGAPETA